MLLVIPHLACNLHCFYCYERQYRKKHKPKMGYDLELILKRMEEVKEIYPEMCLHGGEPLMLPKEDVRKILLKMKELKGSSSIQTNGALIDDDFIEIFKECSTNIGISYDGPGALSEYRLHRLKKDPEIVKKIEKMKKEGLSISMIIVISKSNAGTDQRLKKLKNYFLELDKKQINGRINPCGGAPEYELDEKRIIKVYLDLADFCLHHNLRWSPLTDIINSLQGKQRVCTFMGCDIFHTPSAAELLGDGSLTNCMRTNQDYILLRYPVKYNTRDEILSQTPQEFGGCTECKYWNACHGGCPTMAINNDWRNRTFLCSLWKSLFKFYEKILKNCDIPLCLCKTEKDIKKGEPPEGIDHLDHFDDSHQDDYQGRQDWQDHNDRFDGSHQDDYQDWQDHSDHIDYSHQDNPQDHQDWQDYNDSSK